MALVNVQHKPVTGVARQFDGTLPALTDILGGRPKGNVVATCTFNNAGDFVALAISGGAFGSISVLVGDWVVFPSDASLQPLAVSAAAAAAEWQTLP